MLEKVKVKKYPGSRNPIYVYVGSGIMAFAFAFAGGRTRARTNGLK
jgi:hypothetical protein